MMDLGTMAAANKQQAEKELRQRQQESRRFFSNLEKQFDKSFLQEEQGEESNDLNEALYLRDARNQTNSKIYAARDIVDFEFDNQIESVVNS